VTPNATPDETKHCPRCDGAMVGIELTFGDLGLTMLSCSRCDVRVWVDDDGDRQDLPVLLRDVRLEPRRRTRTA
jgi:hypothetical protein